MVEKFDYTELRKRIGERCENLEEFARIIGISPATLTAKLNNMADFTQTEIHKAHDFLGLHGREITEFFFGKI